MKDSPVRAIFLEDAVHSAAPRATTAELPGTCTAAQKRILVADDDPVVRGSLVAVLESEGYEVDEARDGIETVTRAVERQPDLVLLDLNMPQWDGWTTLSELDRVTSLLPVIVITARPNQYEEAAGFGVDAFMEKPLNFPVLVRVIKRITSEDRNQHIARIANTTFATELLGVEGP